MSERIYCVDCPDNVQYRHITSVEVDAGKVFSRVDVVVMGDRARIDKVPNDLAKTFARVVREKSADSRL